MVLHKPAGFPGLRTSQRRAPYRNGVGGIYQASSTVLVAGHMSEVPVQGDPGARGSILVAQLVWAERAQVGIQLGRISFQILRCHCTLGIDAQWKAYKSQKHMGEWECYMITNHIRTLRSIYKEPPHPLCLTLPAFQPFPQRLVLLQP